MKSRLRIFIFLTLFVFLFNAFSCGFAAASELNSPPRYSADRISTESFVSEREISGDGRNVTADDTYYMWVSSFSTSQGVSSVPVSADADISEKPGKTYFAANRDELKKILIEGIENRETNFIVRYAGSDATAYQPFRSIMEELRSEEGYLFYSVRSCLCSLSRDSHYNLLTFVFRYWSTKEQEEYVDKEIDRILAKIIKPGMSVTARIKAIHDYIVSNIAYDETLVEHSAYAGLAKGTTVCQGYAMLAYKMLKRVGIENRLIEGYAGDQLHLWNIVKIGNRWFHLDCTWDDPTPDEPGRVLYSYFIISDEQISRSHSWIRAHYPRCFTHFSEDGVPVEKDTDAVVFEDGRLEDEIRKIVGKQDGNILKKDVKNITVLRLSSKGIRSIKGLENFSGLRELYLDNNDISSIDPVAWLDNLRILERSMGL